MMKKSKVYIYSTGTESTLILEAPTPFAGKEAYAYIKRHVPTVNIGVLGAKDIQTLYRTHRELNLTPVIKDVKKFVKLASAAKELVLN
jgi:hypothetical protein